MRVSEATALLGAIEGGGTKFVCAVGTSPEDLRAEIRYPTTTPDETLGRAVEFFERQREAHGSLAAVGIGCFGPADIDPRSPTYGRITSTAKPGWRGADILGPIAASLEVPLVFDTDVNAAALGEWRRGAARGLDTFVYLTVGTGIGGGAMVEGTLLHGLLHPEMGHIRVPHDRRADPYPGLCPYHGDCLEGLASGPAIAARWGQAPERLAADHPAWDLEAGYLAHALVNYICILSPQRIIVGGGVMKQERLFALIRRHVQELLDGYLEAPALLDEIERYIVPPALGERAGILGALALAQCAAIGRGSRHR